MPSSSVILNGLTFIANEWRSVAVAWHIALVLSVLAGLMGWRPSMRLAGYLLASPFLSVSAAAFASGNPFNGTVFAALSGLLGAVATHFPSEPVRARSPHVVIAGALLIAFGAGYPHFLATDTWTTYAYAAPLGLLPCPTLAAVIGASLAVGVSQSRRWTFTLTTAAVSYAIVGVFVLGVTLDVALLAGAVVLAEQVALERTSPTR